MVIREDIRVAPPVGGWDILEFVDNQRAQIVAGTSFKEAGQEWVKYTLYPHPELQKRYGISKDLLTKSGLIEKKYLKDTIVTLNEDDPARKVKFCIMNFNGEETPATKWFKGLEQIKVIVKLRKELEGERIHNARLVQENLMLKENIPKYIKTHFTAIAGQILPMLEMQMNKETADLLRRAKENA